MMKILFFTFFSLLSSVGLACQCEPPGKLSEAQKKEIEMSDHIFIGDIIMVSQDKKIVKLKTKEIFKGDFTKGQLIEFENSYFCEPFVEKPGEWLIYGTVENGMFRINICGLSRSIEHPETSRYFSIPQPPPEPNSKMKSVEREREKEKLKKKQKQSAIRETKKEIGELRNLTK